MKLIKLSFFCLIFANQAFAALGRDTVEGIYAEIYGLYTTSDPTCTTGLVPTVPVSATANNINMTQAPDIGVGPVAIPTKCVVMLLRNQVTMAWKSGNYSSTTTSSGTTRSDSLCNAGGSLPVKICNANGGNVMVDWPDQIAIDMAAIGLTPTRICTTAVTGNEIVPIFISTNSACTGNALIDAATAGCVSNGNVNINTFRFPQSAANTSVGIKLTTPEAAGTYKFIIDPDLIMGAGTDSNGNAACANLSPPRFGFERMTAAEEAQTRTQ